jgi:hypothetical protein
MRPNAVVHPATSSLPALRSPRATQRQARSARTPRRATTRRGWAAGWPERDPAPVGRPDDRRYVESIGRNGAAVRRRAIAKHHFPESRELGRVCAIAHDRLAASLIEILFGARCGRRRHVRDALGVVESLKPDTPTSWRVICHLHRRLDRSRTPASSCFPRGRTGTRSSPSFDHCGERSRAARTSLGARRRPWSTTTRCRVD